MRVIIIFILTGLSLASCSEKMMEELPTESLVLSIANSSSFEGTSNPSFTFELTLSKAPSQDVVFDYSVEGITAEQGVDFENKSGEVTILAGDTKASIVVGILDDDVKEVDEKMKLSIDLPDNVEQEIGGGIGTIKDDDTPLFSDPSGYFTAETHFGYNLLWGDEFDGDALDAESFSYEYGDNGWGNNELQNYTDDLLNAELSDSKLTITARQDGGGNYTSSRILTKDKKEFKFGRVDVRAKLPKGQGIWPAIWMLGANIDEVSWPACGEIDIMELVGHQPKKTHGTAHWGLRGEGSTYSTQSFSIDEEFGEQFHVFTIVWEFNRIEWYVDETLFHTMSSGQTQGKPYPFNQEFFFIFNVAVGGNWPGSPDNTTDFPQSMEIDYIRVFQ